MRHIQALMLLTTVAVYGTCDWWGCPAPSGDDYQQQQTQERIRRLEEQEQRRQFRDWMEEYFPSRGY